MGTARFGQIDSLRFFAITTVLSAHWMWSGSQLIDWTLWGVRSLDLFFVISGFLITLGLIGAKEKPQTRERSLSKFYIRRFLRIFPIYYLTVFILWIFWHKQMAGSIGWYLLYLVNFHCIKMQDWGVAGLFWSLSVEEQFYLVWPFIILFIPTRRLPIVMVSCVVLSLVAKTYWSIMAVPFWTPYMHPLGSLDALAMGGLLAYIYHFHEDRLKKILFNPIVIFLVILQTAILINVRHIPGYTEIFTVGIRASFGLFSMWLIGRATFGFTGILGYILNAGPLQYIGKISYAIYLFHDFVPGMLLGLKYPENPNLRFVMYAAVTLGLASLSWHFFESKILKLKDRFE